MCLISLKRQVKKMNYIIIKWHEFGKKAGRGTKIYYMSVPSHLTILLAAFPTKVRIEKLRMGIIRRIRFVCLKYARIKYVGYKVRHVKSS